MQEDLFCKEMEFFVNRKKTKFGRVLSILYFWSVGVLSFLAAETFVWNIPTGARSLYSRAMLYGNTT